MHLRLDAATKRKLARAAAYERKSITEFVLANAVEAAERVIDRRETVNLSPADWEPFFKALVRPPRPSERLREAFRRHRRLTK